MDMHIPDSMRSSEVLLILDFHAPDESSLFKKMYRPIIVT